MVKGSASTSSSKKIKENEEENENPEVIERERLKKLTFSYKMLSNIPANTHSPLVPSKTVTKHHGKDIVRKSQRKSRFLFSFPALLAPVGSSGKIGELKDLATKNPILYLHFPRGQMKLFGTVLYPKNRYLTLQFSRGGKNVVCEDYFDNMIVFSEAWWIGRKEENPEEARLDFPKELFEGQQADCDFKGGAGATSVRKEVVCKSGTKFVEEESPETELENELPDDDSNLKDLKDSTPIRHSERTVGKTFKFAEVSSGDDSIESEAYFSKDEEAEEERKVENNTSSVVVLDIENEGATEVNHFSEQVQASATSKTKLQNECSASLTTSNNDSHSNHGSLVQATISKLFKKVQKKKKVEEKSAPKTARKLPSSKVSGETLRHSDLKRKIDNAEGPRKKGKVTEGRRSEAQKKVYEVEDDIEEFSSSSQDTNGSDDDWAA